MEPNEVVESCPLAAGGWQREPPLIDPAIGVTYISEMDQDTTVTGPVLAWAVGTDWPPDAGLDEVLAPPD